MSLMRNNIRSYIVYVYFIKNIFNNDNIIDNTFCLYNHTIMKIVVHLLVIYVLLLAIATIS
jgi:hypothetical protein